MKTVAISFFIFTAILGLSALYFQLRFNFSGIDQFHNASNTMLGAFGISSFISCILGAVYSENFK